MLKVRTSLDWNYRVQKILFLIHCKRGYHRFGIENDKYMSKGRTRIANYFKCYNCNTLYFPTEKDVRNFSYMEGRMNLFVKSMIKSHNKKNGKATTNN